MYRCNNYLNESETCNRLEKLRKILLKLSSENFVIMIHEKGLNILNRFTRDDSNLTLISMQMSKFYILG